MNDKNIPEYVLEKGISRDDFVKIRDELKNMLLEDVLVKLNDYDAMLENIKKIDSSPNTDKWISNFDLHVGLTGKIINNNVIKIEKLFDKIFEDWEAYQIQQGDSANVEEQSVVDSEVVNNEEVKEEIDDGPEPVLNELTKIDTIEGDDNE